MNLERKSKEFFDELPHAIFSDLYRGTEEEERDKVFGRAGIYHQNGRYYWLINTKTGQTIGEMFYPEPEKVLEKIMPLLEAGLDVANCTGDICVTIPSRLTELASRNWKNFVSMANRWGWKKAKDLKVVELRNPVE